MPGLKVPTESSDSVRSLFYTWKYTRSLPPEQQEVLNPILLAQRAGIDPDPWQADFLMGDDKRVLMNCSRQSGKSTIVAIKAVHSALYEPYSLQIILSPGQRQSKELFDKVKDVYAHIGKPVVSESETALQMRLRNGSRVVSLPGSAGRIRGFSGARRIMIDEAAWVPEDVYRAVRPMLAVSNGDLVAMSTPNGKQGWWYDAWTDPAQDWRRYEIPATMCPRITPEFLDEERATQPEWWVLQEYMCQFTESGQAIFNSKWYEGSNRFDVHDSARHNRVLARWISWDTAMKDKDDNDYAACVVVELAPDYRLHVREVYRERLTFPNLLDEIVRMAQKYRKDGKLQQVVIEDKNSGTSACQTLSAATAPDPWLASKIQPFTPVGSKRQRGSQAAVWCKNGSVWLPTPDEAVPWLYPFEREVFSFTGIEDEHDDQVDCFSQIIIYLENYLKTGFLARYRAMGHNPDQSALLGAIA